MPRDREFVKLWTGQAISRLGSSVTSVGLPLLAVVVLHASPLQMGIMAAAGGAGVLVFGLFAGAWADRLRRRPIMIGADIGRALVVGSVPLAAVLHRLTMEHLYGTALIGGMLTVLFDVSYQAYLPTLVSPGELVAANSRLTLTESFSEVAGPGLTGVMVQLITAPMAILIDAASFLVSAISVASIRKPEPQPERAPDAHLGREIREGLRAVWRDPVLRALAARSATAALFLGSGGSLYFLFTVGELGLSAAVVGTIISVGGAASLLGAFLSERLVRRFGVGRTMIWSAIVTAAGWLLVPLARGPAAVCCAILTLSQVADIGWPIYNINAVSLRQSITPNRLLGRVNSAMHLLFQGLLPLGALLAGAAAQTVGVRNTMLIGGGGFLLSALWLIFSPVRRLVALEDANPID